MNVYDSDRITDALAPLGYQTTDGPEGADMVILNTCHIREKASEKVFSGLGRLRMMKEKARDQQGRNVMIAVAGCVAQAEGEEITRRAPWVDIVVGPQTYHRLPELVAKIDPGTRSRIVDTEFPEEVKFDLLPGEHAPRGALGAKWDRHIHERAGQLLATPELDVVRERERGRRRARRALYASCSSDHSRAVVSVTQ